MASPGTRPMSAQQRSGGMAGGGGAERPMSAQSFNSGGPQRDTLRAGTPMSNYTRPSTAGAYFSEIPARHKSYIPDYTGHVPRLRQTFGMSCLRASDSLSKTVAKPETRTGNLQKLAYVQDGQRKLGLTRGVQLLGTGFTATVAPTSKEKVLDAVEADVYLQGTKVNLRAYYDTCKASNFQNLLIKAGNPGKNQSNVDFGDTFYYCGKHMYETTHKEAFRANTVNIMDGPEPTDAEKEVIRKDRIHGYMVAAAIVGTKRMDMLETQLHDKIQSRVSGGVGLLRRMYTMFDRNGRGEVNPTEFHAVCTELGVKITPNEATSLFGRYDINGDGAMNYYEFLDAFLNEGPSKSGEDRTKYYNTAN
mmetsp:Transcript_23212/g.53899  ORF Transcript_23212/g.53899 Transcript_23212/m.53899 type:complete len:362 (+) Transcript_23212:231-1316(+)